MVARTAHASPADVAAAQGLFDESKKLLASGQYAAAKPKLAESERLDPSPSTEFYLADCYEHLGQTASAWALFLHVTSESKAAGRPDREQFARKRADDLAPRVSHLIITVPKASESEGLEVKRDGELVGAGQWGTAVPVDPGEHSVTATAPKRVDWSQTVEVAADGKTAALEVPPLMPAPVLAASAPLPNTSATAAPSASLEPATSASATDSDRRRSTRNVIALAVGGAGIVAAGVGGIFGAVAISKNNESKTDGCNGNDCTAAGYATRHDAQSDATISSVLVGVGAAAVVGGVVLWLTAPPRAHGNHGNPDAGARRAGLALRIARNGLFLSGAFE